MWIITRGYGSNLIITRGYGLSFIDVREVFRMSSYITRIDVEKSSLIFQEEVESSLGKNSVFSSFYTDKVELISFLIHEDILDSNIISDILELSSSLTKTNFKKSSLLDVFTKSSTLKKDFTFLSSHIDGVRLESSLMGIEGEMQSGLNIERV